MILHRLLYKIYESYGFQRPHVLTYLDNLSLLSYFINSLYYLYTLYKIHLIFNWYNIVLKFVFYCDLMLVRLKQWLLKTTK